MTWKTNFLIGTTALGMAVGVNQMLAVKTPEVYKKYHQQQIVQQGSDAVQMENDRTRDRLPGGIDAENGRELSPREVRPRPAEPKLPKLRWRP